MSLLQDAPLLAISRDDMPLPATGDAIVCAHMMSLLLFFIAYNNNCTQTLAGARPSQSGNAALTVPY